MRILPLFVLAAVASARPAQADTVTLVPALDNTIYEPFTDVSNGKGEYLFAGLTASNLLRRALIEFPIEASIPAGSTINSASIRLHMSMSISGLQPVSFHRVLSAWGEGSSAAPGMEGGGTTAQPGDATWTLRMYPSDAWTTVGGDYVLTASATRSVDTVGFYNWPSNAALVADVQSWVDSPSSNHGWIVLSSEDFEPTSKRFDSRENSTASFRPMLMIDFTPPEPCPTTATAVETVRLGTPGNPNALLPGVTSRPLIGATWDPLVDHTTFATDSIVDLLAVSPIPSNTSSPFGTLLCDIAAPTLYFTATPGAAFDIAIPNNCAFVGLDECAQAASINAAGVVLVTNALDLTIGNQ